MKIDDLYWELTVTDGHPVDVAVAGPYRPGMGPSPDEQELAAAERRHAWSIVSEQLAESLAPMVARYWKALRDDGVPAETADRLAAELQSRFADRFMPRE